MTSDAMNKIRPPGRANQRHKLFQHIILKSGTLMCLYYDVSTQNFGRKTATSFVFPNLWDTCMSYRNIKLPASANINWLRYYVYSFARIVPMSAENERYIYNALNFGFWWSTCMLGRVMCLLSYSLRDCSNFCAYMIAVYCIYFTL